MQNEQLTILKNQSQDLDLSGKACAFTGHRELAADFSARKLKREIKRLIALGITTFYNGVAMGFDLLAAEYVLECKKKFPHIRLIVCIPCYAQEKYYPEKDKARYANILKDADERILLSDHYYRGCMQNRDRYMADRADVLLAYCNKETGGAAYTVRYFQKTHDGNMVFFI
ncbi:MAG: DUF1273 family protein [Clostridia bacterium]|nr:DUF1273 family protein [Clostridia bacterium]